MRFLRVVLATWVLAVVAVPGRADEDLDSLDARAEDDGAIFGKFEALAKAGDNEGISAIGDRVIDTAERSFGDSPENLAAIIDVVATAHYSDGKYRAA